MLNQQSTEELDFLKRLLYLFKVSRKTHLNLFYYYFKYLIQVGVLREWGYFEEGIELQHL